MWLLFFVLKEMRRAFSEVSGCTCRLSLNVSSKITLDKKIEGSAIIKLSHIIKFIIFLFHFTVDIQHRLFQLQSNESKTKLSSSANVKRSMKVYSYTLKIAQIGFIFVQYDILYLRKWIDKLQAFHELMSWQLLTLNKGG